MHSLQHVFRLPTRLTACGTAANASRVLRCTTPARCISRSPSSRNAQTPKAEGKQKPSIVEDPANEHTAWNATAEASLPLLQRPLGVEDRPTSQPKTWEQKREELLDQEKRMKKRQELVREATKGYFTDLNATRRHGGKTWIAPKTMIREDKALYFPDIVGTTLKSKADVHTTSLCMGKVSIIALLTTRVSELQAANYVKPTHDTYSTHPSYRYVQVNLQENLLKSFLVSLFISSIRKSVPQELWDTYLVSSQNMDYVRHDLGMSNSRIGYVYLVDEQCRVRWAACADPMVEEVEALKVCTGVLLKRHGDKRERS